MTIVISEPGERSNPYLNRLKLVHGDIAEQAVDAIVTIIPQTLEYRGEINQTLIDEAGAALDEFILDNIYKPRPGDIYAVPGFDLPCEHILLCIVPNWKDDFDRQNKHLTNAVRKAMETAKDMNLKTLAFPPIGSGKNGFAKQRAARLIVQGIFDRLDVNFEEVRIVCHEQAVVDLFKERLEALGWSV